MPHHESGLLALKTTEPRLLDLAVQHFLKQEPNHAIDVVRVDEGRGVWLCFGSVISNQTMQHVDVSAFQDDPALAELAKELGVPLWVGYAIGGYSNHQFATAFSASGEVEWRSECDFTWPEELRAEADDAFTSPERYQELAIAMRAGSGYGKISQEFGVDYFRVLDVEAGDALFATEKRSLGENGFAELAGWLKGPWRNPEGNPGDGAAPPPPADWVAWKLPNNPEAILRLAGVITCALEHLHAPLDGARLTLSDHAAEAWEEDKDQVVVMLGGPAARVASSLVLTQRFTELASGIAGTALSIFRGEGDAASLSMGVGDPGASISLSMRGGPGLTRPARGRPLELTASHDLRAAVELMRRPQVEEPDDDEEGEKDLMMRWMASMIERLGAARKEQPEKKPSKKPAPKKSTPKKRAAPKKAAKRRNPKTAMRRKR